MKIKQILFLVLLLSLCFAQKTFSEYIEGITGLTEFTQYFLGNWQLVALLLLLISALLSSIAIAAGKGFGMAQLEAWGKMELEQVFVNVVVILFILSFISLIDTLSADILRCGQYNCIAHYALTYLDDYTEQVKTQMEDVFEDGVQMGKISSLTLTYSGGFFTNKIVDKLMGGGWFPQLMGKLMYFSTVSFSPAGHFTLYLMRDQIVFNNLATAYVSLTAQKFFLSSLAFTLGPFFILAGVVLRSFFLTRRWGATLIAVGFGAMIVFPALFILAYATTDNKFSTDVAPTLSTCPLECQTYPPVAFNKTDPSQTFSYVELFDYAVENEWPEERFEGIVNGSTPEYDDVVTCNNFDCPGACRSLPYQYGTTACGNSSAIKECRLLYESKPKCFVSRVAVNVDFEKIKDVPSECRVVAPLKIDEKLANCTSKCMAVYTNGENYCVERPPGCTTPQGDFKGIWEQANYSFYENNMEGMVDAAKQTSVYIIHENSKEADCSVLLNLDDPGFGYLPPVFLSCHIHCVDRVPSQTYSSTGMLSGIKFVDVTGKIMINAYLLPLFNIAATIVFISGLASWLGGELFVPAIGELI